MFSVVVYLEAGAEIHAPGVVLIVPLGHHTILWTTYWCKAKCGKSLDTVVSSVYVVHVETGGCCEQLTTHQTRKETLPLEFQQDLTRSSGRRTGARAKCGKASDSVVLCQV